MHYETLLMILAGLIGKFICPDRRSQGFDFGWEGILDSMMQHRNCYAWGVCMLAHLYHDLHQVVYDGGASLSSGCTLL